MTFGLSVVLALSLQVSDARAFRYVCNSVDASGVPVAPDIWGACSEDTAARWSDPRVPLTIFNQALPTDYPVAAWEAAVVQGLTAWSLVPGCALVFEPADAAPGASPGWGAGDDGHDVFWVSGPPGDWEALTLTNPETTIALSAVRYRWDKPGSSSREIFDADVVLNNTGPAWECKGQAQDCWSVEHALTHELGHALGLGHACGQCQTVLMVALADPSFQPAQLFSDDEDGCRALYPPQPDAVEAVEAAEAVEHAETGADVGPDAADVADGELPQDCHCGGSQRRAPDPAPLVALGLLLLWRRRQSNSARAA